MSIKEAKRGQVTIFIIIGIVIVALGLLIYFLLPKIKTTLGVSPQSPEEFIETCIKDEITNAVEKISLQGGSLEPTAYTLFNDEKVQYTCYTSEYYATCTVQQPLLVQHIEKELSDEISPLAEDCFNSLKENYENQGYNVEMNIGSTSIQLLPERILSTFSYTVTLTKANTERYDSFDIILNNNLYESIGIANNIIEYESTYGEADPAIYMTLYKDWKVEKNSKSDGSRVYVITDKTTGDKFQLATRSLVWPAGYG